jgi:hypothetical protein
MRFGSCLREMLYVGSVTPVLLEVHAGVEPGCCFAILVGRLDSNPALAFQIWRRNLAEPGERNIYQPLPWLVFSTPPCPFALSPLSETLGQYLVIT